VVVAAELDAGALARRLRRALGEIYGYPSDVHVLASEGWRTGAPVPGAGVSDGPALARRAGLIDARGRPVWGLSRQALSGGVCAAASAWRGAFLAQGSLTEPGRSPALEMGCPGPEAAMSLVGAARRLRVTAHPREVRGSDRVIVRDGTAIGALLSWMRTPQTRARWQERRMRRQDLRATGNRPTTFDDTNLRRTAEAAGAAVVRVSRALHILGDSPRTIWERPAPCGCTTSTPLCSLHRLVALADRVARGLEVPDTASAITPDP